MAYPTDRETAQDMKVRAEKLATEADELARSEADTAIEKKGQDAARAIARQVKAFAAELESGVDAFTVEGSEELAAVYLEGVLDAAKQGRYDAMRDDYRAFR